MSGLSLGLYYMAFLGSLNLYTAWDQRRPRDWIASLWFTVFPLSLLHIRLYLSGFLVFLSVFTPWKQSILLTFSELARPAKHTTVWRSSSRGSSWETVVFWLFILPWIHWITVVATQWTFYGVFMHPILKHDDTFFSCFALPIHILRKYGCVLSVVVLVCDPQGNKTELNLGTGRSFLQAFQVWGKLSIGSHLRKHNQMPLTVNNECVVIVIVESQLILFAFQLIGYRWSFMDGCHSSAIIIIKNSFWTRENLTTNCFQKQWIFMNTKFNN